MALDADARARARRAAGEAAALLVTQGMTVGLGTGDTAAHAVRALADRFRGGLQLRGVATSKRTAELAGSLALPLVDLDAVDRVDLTIDGADEIDEALRLIKGGGGALLGEKLVARASRRVVIVADTDKRVVRLGDTHRLPVEIVRFGARQTLEALGTLGLEPLLRSGDGDPYVTDGGHHIADCRVPAGVDIVTLDRAIKLVTGVVETGFFLDLTSEALIGDADGKVTSLLPR